MGNPERDWGRPSWPTSKPSKSVRTPKPGQGDDAGGCPFLLVKVIPMTLKAMWVHRKELFATGLLVLAAACGGASQHPQPKPDCHDTDGHRIECVRVGRK